MSEGILLKFITGEAGKAGAWAKYITRLSSTKCDLNGIILHNYPERFRHIESYQEMRERIIEFNQEREHYELGLVQRGPRGKRRTFYKCVASLSGKVETELVREMCAEYLARAFPLARAAACIHQNTANTHWHCLVQARQVSGRKIDFRGREYTNLDVIWAEIYADRFGREHLEMHLKKKAEMKAARAKYAAALARGEDGRDVVWPERAPRRLGVERIREIEARAYAQDRLTGSERSVAGADRGVGSRESIVDRAIAESERATRAAREAIRGVDEVRGELERLGERAREEYERGWDIER